MILHEPITDIQNLILKGIKIEIANNVFNKLLSLHHNNWEEKGYVCISYSGEEHDVSHEKTYKFWDHDGYPLNSVLGNEPWVKKMLEHPESEAYLYY